LSFNKHSISLSHTSHSWLVVKKFGGSDEEEANRVKATVTGMHMSRTNKSQGNNPERGKVADDSARPSHNMKQLGCRVTNVNAISAIAPDKISAIMRDNVLSAIEKQQVTQALRGQQSFSSEWGYSRLKVNESSKLRELTELHAAWHLDKPLLPVDSRGLTMWPRSNMLSNSETKMNNWQVFRAGVLELERAPSVPSPWTSDSEESNSADDCDRTNEASLFFDRSSSAPVIAAVKTSRSFDAVIEPSAQVFRSGMRKHVPSVPSPWVSDSEGSADDCDRTGEASLFLDCSASAPVLAVKGGSANHTHVIADKARSFDTAVELPARSASLTWAKTTLALQATSIAENARNKAALAQVKAKANRGFQMHAKAQTDTSMSKIARFNIMDKGSAQGKPEDIWSNMSTRPSTPDKSWSPRALLHINLSWKSLEEEDPFSTASDRPQSEGLGRVCGNIKEWEGHKQQLQRVKDLNTLLLLQRHHSMPLHLPHSWPYWEHEPHTQQPLSRVTEGSLRDADRESLQQGVEWRKFKATMRKRIAQVIKVHPIHKSQTINPSGAKRCIHLRHQSFILDTTHSYIPHNSK